VKPPTAEYVSQPGTHFNHDLIIALALHHAWAGTEFRSSARLAIAAQADKAADEDYTPPVPDVFTKAKRSQVMAAIRSRGNKDTEVKLAAILRAARIRGWRRHQPVPGRPDFVFRRLRLAVFVDGCFWHGCPKHGRSPGSNREYWLPKLRRNKERDAAVARQLSRTGWSVIRLWEHQLANPVAVSRRITRALTLLQKAGK
jgi:DNA mismatch endonuclease (patch repair protein)